MRGLEFKAESFKSTPCVKFKILKEAVYVIQKEVFFIDGAFIERLEGIIIRLFEKALFTKRDERLIDGFCEICVTLLHRDA